MPGLVELLAALERNRVPKGIATSSRRGFVARVLGQFGWEHRFNPVLTADDIVEGKPHPEIYQKAAARLGLLPGEVLVLEDSHNGCKAAVAAGAIAVAVPAQHSLRHDFTGAEFIAQSLADRRIYARLGISPA
jgi:HAD superfamily hydrolase (TIGR01509 family)